MRALTAPGGGRVVVAEVDDPQPAPGHAVVEVAAFSINRARRINSSTAWRPGKDLAGLTALRLLRVAGPLPSRKALLTGASGGVGHYFAQLASAQGALVTAVTGSSDRGGRLIELGAIDVIRDITDAAGPFDVAIESIGGHATRAAWHRLEQHGLLIWIGQASQTPPELDYFDWDGAMSVTIRKFNYLDSTHSEADDLAPLVRLVSTGRLHPELGLVEDGARTGEAIAQLLDRQVRGNAVLTIAA